jgi:RNA 3'-terminal phosphate cyclase (ATP)
MGERCDTFAIDGSCKSGSGTIVRYAVALASLLKRDLHIRNIRAKRGNPGLRPQHLKAVEACCTLTGGTVEGARVGSTEILYRPGDRIKGGSHRWDIGTAGSTTMMAYCLLPVCLFSGQSFDLTLVGGLFQDFAPNAYHMEEVLIPLLRRMGVDAEIDIEKPGYVPAGGGILRLCGEPARGKLKPLRMLEPGPVNAIKGLALSSHLEERNVGGRMRKACLRELAEKNLEADLRVANDTTADQKGAALFVCAETGSGCIIGADRAGKLGRSAEEIGRYTARSLIEDLASGATVDRYTADQLILFAALADGESAYRVPRMTDHIESNLWLVGEMLGAKGIAEGNLLRIRGVGFSRR